MNACPACNGMISPKAFTCPHCGHPLRRAPPPKARTSPLTALLAIVLIPGVIIAVAHSTNDASSTDNRPALSDAQCRQDLKCIGEKLAIDLAGPCKRSVDRYAAHDAKWDDGVLSPVISEYAWTGQPGGNVNLIGDRVRFQNGFGNFMRVTYICTVNPEAHSIVATDVHDGMLKPLAHKPAVDILKP